MWFNNKGKDGSKNEKRQLFKFKKLKKMDKASATSIDNEKSPKKKKNKKLKWKIFKICLFIAIAMVIIGTGVVLGVVTGIIDDTESLNLEEIQGLKRTTFIYDKDNQEIAALYDEENRVILEYKDVPKIIVDAVTSIEDERFFSHHGVDVKRTAGAVFNYVIHFGKSDFGGSTLTQQLVKNIKKDKETSWVRKVREWYRAYSLENKLNKEQIFAAYVNTIYMGDGSYGFEVASRNYFSKSLKDVNIAEAAVLAAIIQSPEDYNPYKSDKAKETLINRQKVVLNKMLELGKITKEQYDEAINYKIEFKKEADDVQTANIHSYFVDEVIEQVVSDLQEQKNVSRGMALNMLYTQGYKIYTTQDAKVQKIVDDAYNSEKLFYTDKQGDFMQSAMVVMDQHSGNVLGITGGANKKTGNRVLNRATQLPRQPGSTMKAIGAYGPAFELGISYPAMGIDDSPITVGNWTPVNYYGYYNGYVTTREALAKSMNLPAIRTTQKVGIDYAYNFARNMGLTNLNENDKNLASLAIGGSDTGSTVLQMANAYATIANGGVYLKPRFYTKILDKDNKEVIVKNSEAKSVMKETTAYLLNDMLQGVVKAGGTANGYVKVGKMPIAGKTGNTNSDYDQWFIGFSPYYTIACWNGYDEVGGKKGKKAIGYRTGIKSTYPYTSVVLFNTVMNELSKGQEVKQFDKPSGIVTASVCKVSGLVATDACKADPRGDTTITDIFASGTVPTATCNIHKLVDVCSITGLLANEFCPKVQKSFITRDYVPSTKPRDWQYMVPTDKCTVHTEPEQPPIVEDPDDVDIY
ncbi:MAG: penicillin-binding protein [Clostridia bacterium]|nr:penicillin-binding protein [Clostridia bacterium]